MNDNVIDLTDRIKQQANTIRNLQEETDRKNREQGKINSQMLLMFVCSFQSFAFGLQLMLKNDCWSENFIRQLSVLFDSFTKNRIKLNEFEILTAETQSQICCAAQATFKPLLRDNHGLIQKIPKFKEFLLAYGVIDL